MGAAGITTSQPNVGFAMSLSLNHGTGYSREIWSVDASQVGNLRHSRQGCLRYMQDAAGLWL